MVTDTSIDTTTDVRIDPKLGDGDHDKFAHYVNKNEIVESAVSGKQVIALCGKKWIPNRDPSAFPVCPSCKAIYEGLRANELGDD